MNVRCINPYDGSILQETPVWTARQLEDALVEVAGATPLWASTPLEARVDLLKRAAAVLRTRKQELAKLISQEMGKLIGEAVAEIEKCAWVCEYYAEQAETFLADEIIETDASRSLVAYLPIGTVLAVMPWNFPFWQVFRFAAPSLAAGNTAVLKHASNVPQCALAIEDTFKEAGFPKGVFRSLMISSAQTAKVIEDPRIQAVTLTGSEPAGIAVASTAARVIKKSVLELGGSDAFVVLEDADMDEAVKAAAASRYLNAGQSCIAAKRFIVVERVADEFVQRLKEAAEKLRPGHPLDSSTTLAPMARHDLRDELHQQVVDSIAKGARVVTGCMKEEGPGAFYQASILDHVAPGQRAYSEEFFGPVALVIRVSDEDEALRVANDSRFGLAGSVWTQDSERGERFARNIQSGATFVNGMVKSDPRLPFGGVKASGFGRELYRHGMHEFVNAKTLWIK
ncbi:MAG: NAD-dependent succinate-semialdehyde dehydrogenase [Gammaproteobacteria bacterium]|nr:MAG: NAD-dependent succinate-semialdehyde dehydrogenase [Gammaproteobacteria bacterium]